MKQSPKVEAVSILVMLLGIVCALSLILLVFAFLLSVFYFHRSTIASFIFETGFNFLAGMVLIYKSVKKMRQALAEQRQIVWYKQPSLLTGIALLLSVPDYIIFSSNPTALNSLTPSFVSYFGLLAIILLFLIAAAYFWLQEKRRRKAVGGK